MLELVVVIVIFSMLMGLAVAVFRNANRDLGVRAAMNHVVTLLRSAAEHSKAEGAPTEVVCDVKANTIHTLTKETLLMFHMEDERGAFGRNTVPGGVQTVPGYISNAQRFNGSATMVCTNVPVNAKDPGIAIECHLYRTQAGRGKQTIAMIGKATPAELWIEGNGRLAGRVGNVQVTSGDYYLNKFDQWYSVQFVYNTLEAKLFVNDLEVGTRAGKAEWAAEGVFTIGSSREGFNGIIDEMRVSLIIPRDVYTMPAETKFAFAQGTTFIEQRYFIFWFNSKGRLDPSKHLSAVTFGLKSPTDQKNVTVTTQGDVNR